MSDAAQLRQCHLLTVPRVTPAASLATNVALVINDQAQKWLLVKAKLPYKVAKWSVVSDISSFFPS